jgi:hypothetical protein
MKVREICVVGVVVGVVGLLVASSTSNGGDGLATMLATGGTSDGGIRTDGSGSGTGTGPGSGSGSGAPGRRPGGKTDPIAPPGMPAPRLPTQPNSPSGPTRNPTVPHAL